MSSVLADIVTELPYPGLRPFEPNESHIFFGREQHITELLTRLKIHRFLGVVGPSGCGKSSLIRAGLIPALQGGFMDRSKRHWNSAILRPSNQPMRMLASALTESGVFGDPKEKTVSDIEQLCEDLSAGSRSLANRLILNQSAQNTNLLILIDQFEELFRFEREGGGDESRAFVNLMLETARATDVSAYIVLTMRTDFLGQCPVFAGLPEALNESQYLTPRLTREQVEEAIVGPARLYGGEVDDDVVARILNEMGTDPDQLPLMQHLLMRMWRSATRREATAQDPFGEDSRTYNGQMQEQSAHLMMADYLAAGGLADALSNHAESVFLNRLKSDQERQLAEQMFRNLTDVAANGELVRRSPAPELAALCEKLRINNPLQLHKVVDEFRSEGRSFIMPPPAEKLKPNTLIDISHESLIRKWPRLQQWTRDEARATEVRQEITQYARNWDAGGRKSDDSQMPKSRWLAALEWKESHPFDVTEQIGDFLMACKRRDDEETLKDRQLQYARNKNRIVIIVATVIFAMATVAIASYAMVAKQKRATDSILAKQYWRDAAQQFLGSSNFAKSADLASGLMWLVEAYCKEPTLTDSKRELYETRFSAALAQHPELCQVWRHTGVSVMATSADSRFVITAGEAADHNERHLHNELRIWRNNPGIKPQDDKALDVLDVDPGITVNAVKFYGEGENLYILAALEKKGSKTGSVKVWHWPQTTKSPTLISNQSLSPLKSVVNADFVSPTDDSTTPGIVALVKDTSTTVVKYWKSLDDMPVDLQPGAVDEPLSMLVVQRDQGLVAAWGSDTKQNAFHLWNLRNLSGTDSTMIPPTVAILFGEFSSSGKYLATVDMQGQAFLRNAVTGSIINSWKAYEGTPLDVAFSPNEQYIVTAGDDKMARVWEIRKRPNEAVSTIDQPFVTKKSELPHASSVNKARFSPDGRWVATAGRDRLVQLWSAATGTPVGTPLHHAFGLSGLEFSSDGNCVFTKIRDTVQTWQLSTQNPYPRVFWAGTLQVKAATSSNMQFQVVFGKTKEGITERIEGRVWNLASGKSTHDQPLNYPTTKQLRFVCISNDGKHVLASSQEKEQSEVEIWDVANERSYQLKQAGLGGALSAAFSPDNQFVITVSERQTPVTGSLLVQVWNVETGEPQLKNPTEHVGPVNQIVWNDTSNLVLMAAGTAKSATQRDGVATLWQWYAPRNRLEKKQEYHHPDRDQSSNAILFAAFSPDNKIVATSGADDTAYLWSASTGRLLSQPLQHASDIVHVVFSSDGKKLATSSIGDKKSCVWDVAKVKLKPRLPKDAILEAEQTFEHDGPVNQSVFDADDKYLATVSDDGTARVWSLSKEGDGVAIFKHDGVVQMARFAENGALVTISQNRWPQRWQWRLRPSAQNVLPLNEQDTLRNCFRLLAAGDLDASKASMRPLSSGDGLSTSEAERAEIVERLWQTCSVYLTPTRSSPPTHLQSADASEAAAQWFAAAWHLEQELRDAPEVGTTSTDEKRQFAELYARCGRAIMRQDIMSDTQWNKVEQLFSKAIEFEPEQWQRYAERASIREQTRNKETIQSAMTDYDTAINLSPSPDYSLYDRRARLNEKLDQPAAAIADWTEAIRLAPPNMQSLLRSFRAENYAKLKDWDQARADFEAHYKAAPNVGTGYSLALLQLKAGDMQGYRETCAQLSKKYEHSPNVQEVNTVVWLCALAPEDRQSYSHLIDVFKPLAEQAASKQLEDFHLYLTTLGALQFRAGNFSEAKDWIDRSREMQIRNREKSLSRDASADTRQSKSTGSQSFYKSNRIAVSDDIASDWDRLFLAMSYQELGDPNSAQKWLKLSRDSLEFKANYSWDARIELELLLAEAIQKVEGAHPPSP